MDDEVVDIRVGESDVPIIPKAVVYLTRTDPTTHAPHLVVFDHVDAPEAGTQVPAGTVEADEDVADAALREAFEETGLAGIRLVAALGTEDVDLRPYGVQATARRHFFHATIDSDAGVVASGEVDVDADADVSVPVAPDRWRHVESHRSDGGPSVTFELYWAPLASPPVLAGELGARLWMVQAALIPNIDGRTAVRQRSEAGQAVAASRTYIGRAPNL